jgi:hypothetical protein
LPPCSIGWANAPVKVNAWTQARVCTFRTARQLRADQPGERKPGEMTVQEVADALKVSPMRQQQSLPCGHRYESYQLWQQIGKNALVL